MQERCPAGHPHFHRAVPENWRRYLLFKCGDVLVQPCQGFESANIPKRRDVAHPRLIRNTGKSFCQILIITYWLLRWLNVHTHP